MLWRYGGMVGLALGVALADAEDRLDAGSQCRRNFFRQRLVSLAEELAALGVADDGEGDALAFLGEDGAAVFLMVDQALRVEARRGVGQRLVGLLGPKAERDQAVARRDDGVGGKGT